MIRAARMWTMAAVIVVTWATPLAAHHSFTAEYDIKKQVKVRGIVTKVEWTNPHIWFYVDVQEPNGTVTQWAFAGAPPLILVRRGISKDVIKPGMVVTVEAFGARDGSNNGAGGVVTLEDGRALFTASAEDPTPGGLPAVGR